MNKKKTQVILARHGETEWNASEVFRGRADIPLNKKGEKQAECLGEYLKKEKIDAVYASPLKRAMKTAMAVAERQNLEVNTAPALLDIHYGEWQGLANIEVQLKYPFIYHTWLNAPEKAKIPGGESLGDVQNRIMPFLQDMLGKHDGQTIVLVSHRVVHKVFICALLKMGNQGFYSIKLDTAGISRFEFGDGQAVLVSHNDISYLNHIGGPALADF